MCLVGRKGSPMTSEPPDMEKAELNSPCGTCPDSSASQAEAPAGDNVQRKPRKILWAAILSLFVPGLGQVYNGQLAKGLVFWVAQLALVLMLVGLGLILTFYGCALFAIFVILICLGAFIEAIVTARRLKAVELKAYNRWYIYVGAIILYSFCWDFFLPEIAALKTYRVPARSMQPTLEVGDHFFAHLGEYRAKVPMRGEIIVFEFPEDLTKDFVKRVIAVGGDTIEIRDKKVFLNGKMADDPKAQFVAHETFPAQLSPRDNLRPLVVPAGSLFVMGDNRDFSHDSRFFGFVDIKAVKGKVLFIYWAEDKSRIGRSVQ
jgi:signal peptidase I